MIIYARGLYDRVAPSTNYYCFNKLPLFYNSYFEAFVIKMIKKSRAQTQGFWNLLFRDSW